MQTAMKFDTHSCILVIPSSGQNQVSLSNTLVYEQIPAKLMTFHQPQLCSCLVVVSKY